MAVPSDLRSCVFFIASAGRHQTKEADQEHRTDHGCWGFHWNTLQKWMKLNDMWSSSTLRFLP
jgi:hypothetical protein